MKRINEVCENRNGHRPERILQFGEGNFLRAFIDWMIDKANNSGNYDGSIVVCQPIARGLADALNAQDGMYTLIMRGMENGTPVERTAVPTSISRCINPYEAYDALLVLARSETLEVVISNTTEAGISYHAGDRLTDAPPASFPAKVTAFLYERFRHFQGDPAKGLLFLPVELIDDNGAELKRIVLRYAREWDCGDAFLRWIEEANHFTSTLVDGIVTGYPRDDAAAFEEKLGYQDRLINTAELFHLWVIEGKKEWSALLPIHLTDDSVIWTDDVKPYKKRKVRILNGAHTATVPAAYLAGHDIVLDFMKDGVFHTYMNALLQQEVIPTIDLPKEELAAFAEAVNDRFLNPFIRHRLLDISLNSCSKFCARCLPSLLDYQAETGTLPKHLTFALAAFFRFYRVTLKDGVYSGVREDGSSYPVRDDEAVLARFAQVWAENDSDAAAHALLSETAFWNGRDLTEIDGLAEAVAGYLRQMEERPIREVIAALEEKQKR